MTDRVTVVWSVHGAMQVPAVLTGDWTSVEMDKHAPPTPTGGRLAVVHVRDGTGHTVTEFFSSAHRITVDKDRPHA